MGDGAKDALSRTIRGGLPYHMPGGGPKQVFCCLECGKHARSARGTLRHQKDAHGIDWPLQYTGGDFDPPRSVWDGHIEPIDVYLVEANEAGTYFRFGHTHTPASVEIDLNGQSPVIRVLDGENEILEADTADLALRPSGQHVSFSLKSDTAFGCQLSEDGTGNDDFINISVRADDGKKGGLGIGIRDRGGRLAYKKQVKLSSLEAQPTSSPAP